MVRKIGAVVGGMAVVFVVVSVLQWVGSLIHPLPPGVDPMDPADQAAFRAHLATMPAAAWGIAWASELLAAFLGGLTAGKIADTRRPIFAGVIVGLALLASIMNWLAFPHPAWFIVGQLVLYPLVFFGVTKLLPDNPYEGME